jgi:DinB superfamily
MNISFLVGLALFIIGSRNPGPGELTPAERKFAIDYLNKTKVRLLNDVKGLSAAQLYFRPDDTTWSVAQCVEHIALSEDLIKQWAHGSLVGTATPERKSEEKYTPQTLIVIVTDRSQNRSKTGGPWLPDGQFPTTAAAIQAFVSRRDSTIAYVESTQDDLKEHFIDHPQWGALDLYEAFVMLSAHCERHTEQLEEVMANPNFPKK